MFPLPTPLILTPPTVLVVLAVGLHAPTTVGRVLAGAGFLTAPWMGIRVGTMTLSDVLFAGSLPFLLLDLRQIGGVRVVVRGPQRWMLVVAVWFLLGGVIGSLATPGVEHGFGTALRFVVTVLVVSTVMTDMVRGRGEWMNAASLYVLGAATSALVAMLRPGEYGLGRSIGLTTHPNHLGMSMMLAATLCIPLLASSRGRERLLGLVGGGLVVLALVDSGSRAALLGLVIAVVTFVAVSRRVRSAVLLPGLLLTVFLLAFLPGTVAPGSSSLSRTFAPGAREAQSSAGRLARTNEAWELIRDRPVTGHGFADALTFHSVPLQILVVGGLLGAVALVIAAGAAGRFVRRALRRESDVIVRASAAGVVGTFGALAVSNQLYDRYLVVALALMSAGAALARSPSRSDPSRRAWVGAR